MRKVLRGYKFFIISSLSLMFFSNLLIGSTSKTNYAKIYSELNKQDSIKYSSSYNSSNQDDDTNAPLKSIFANLGADKITPSPNEEIDLYSGTLKLHYTDFSTPIAPGLNLELNRVYESTVYNYINYPQAGTVWAYDYNLPSWNIGISYIYDRLNSSCMLSNDPCDLIVINPNGSNETLRRETNISQKWTSKSGSVFDGHTGILLDKRGFKYYFGDHLLDVNGGARLYLTKVETPDGNHWLKYKYNGGHYLTQISSSDPEKTIDIIYKKFPFYKYHIGSYSISEPSNVKFNNKEILKYDYKFYDGGHEEGDSFGKIALSRVTKVNGDYINYGYEFISLQKIHESNFPSNWRLMLNSVSHSNGESEHYTYVDDNDLYSHMYLRTIRLNTVTHNTNNKLNKQENSNIWSIAQDYTGTYNGIKSKSVVVRGPYHATKTIYSHSSNGYAWQAGLPLEHYIYKDINLSDANIAQKDVYTWDKKLFSKRYYYLSSSLKEAGFDTQTFKPRLKSKKTTRYNVNSADTYTVNISDYDEYDNPKTIILTGSDGSKKTISQSYYNNIDNNILGLVLNTAINNNIIQKQEYDNYGNLVLSNNLGKISNYTYSNGFLSSATDVLGNTEYYENYLGTQPSLIRKPDRNILTKEINLDGTVKSETDAKGATTNYLYSNNKELLEVKPSIGASTKYSYSSFNKYSSLDNYNSEEEYNHAGLLLSKTENNERKKVYEYDGLGRKIFESYDYFINKGLYNYKGHYYKYDSLDRLVSDCYPSKD